jgi:membrane fusion protein, multidrug efflux system
VQRLDASIANERRRVERHRNLRQRGTNSQEMLDDVEAALAIVEAEREAASARLAIVEDRLRKAEIYSPLDGMVETRHVAVGDYVRSGDDLLTVIDTRHLRVALPFPEPVADQLAVGQTVAIESPLVAGLTIEAPITALKPALGALNRAVTALIDLDNPGRWRPDATVTASVTVDRRAHAVIIPALAVVARPAGAVVYLVEGKAVRAQAVELGQRLGARVEVRTGLKPGDVVVVEGAPYLTDGAAITIAREKTAATDAS